VLLRVVLGTDQVQLVVFPGQIAFVNINNIVGVVQTKDWVGRVPKNKMGSDGTDPAEE